MSRPARALGIDIGTSSVRTQVVDADGHPLDEPHKSAYPAGVVLDGGARFDPAGLLAHISAAVDAAMAGGVAVDAVGISCFWHSVVALDEHTRPLTDVLTWAFTDARPGADAIGAEVDPAEVHRRTGAFVHSSFVPAKVRWLRAARPEVFAATRWWVDVSDWLLTMWFGGPPRTSVSMASGTGLLDLHTAAWDPQMLAVAGTDAERLPGVSFAPRVGLLGEHARRWPALADVPWFPVIGDGACSNIGAGATGRDRAAINVGTSAAIRVVWEADAVTVSDELWCYRVDDRRFVMGGALSSGGNLREWLYGVLALPADAEERLAGRAPAEHGLTMLPLLAGERTPGYLSNATGAVAGLAQTTDALDLLQAGLEAVALSCRTVWDALRLAHPGIDLLLATGGGMRESALWRQMMADALGHPIVTSAVAEGSVRGAALLALESLGHPVELRATTTGAMHRPDPTAAATLDAAHERQRALYRLLRASWGARPS